MTEKEHEFKMMLTKDEYHLLLRFFYRLMVESGLQTNYYYDTRNEDMRKKNVTVRVREKNNRLIGTIKRHLDTQSYSIEEHFGVDTIPRVIMLDDTPLWLQGSLETERKIFKVCDGITMMLDLNRYFDAVDYELEIEFFDVMENISKWLRSNIKTLLNKNLKNTAVAKSERFFKTEEGNGGVSCRLF